MPAGLREALEGPRLSVEERSVGWMEFVTRRWCESRGVACIALPAPTAVAAAYAGACGRGGTSPCAPRPPRRSTPLAELSPEQERSLCWPGADEHTEQAQGASDFAATTPSDPAPPPPPPPLKRAVSPVGTTAKWYRRVRISPDSAKSAVSAAPAGDVTMSSDVGGSGAGGAAACEQRRSDDSGSDGIESCSASSSPCPSSSSDGESASAASKDQRSDGSDSAARDTVMAGADEAAAAGGDTPPAADLGTAAAAAAASSNAEDARRVLEVIVEEADLATVDTAAAAARSSARVDETTSHTLDVNGDLTRDSEDLLQERLSPSDDDAGVNVPPPPPRPPAGSPIVGGDDMYDGECGGDGGAAALYESGDAVLSFPDHIALERVDDDAGAGAERKT